MTQVFPALLGRSPKVMGRLAEPTAGERKNGWTAESLTSYLDQRDTQIADYARSPEVAKAAKVRRIIAESQTTDTFDPLNWNR